LRCGYAFIALLVSLLVVACTQDSKTVLFTVNNSPTESKVLKIWWDKGFTLEEDEALQQLVSNWEKQTSNKVKLSFYSTDELSQKVEGELQTGDLLDIIALFKADGAIERPLANFCPMAVSQ
jgi:multiple sugar transport system substrate-binding protein